MHLKRETTNTILKSQLDNKFNFSRTRNHHQNHKQSAIWSTVVFSLDSLVEILLLEFTNSNEWVKFSTILFNPLSTNLTKWSNTVSRRIVWVCLTILWGLRSKSYHQYLWYLWYYVLGNSTVFLLEKRTWNSVPLKKYLGAKIVSCCNTTLKLTLISYYPSCMKD